MENNRLAALYMHGKRESGKIDSSFDEDETCNFFFCAKMLEGEGLIHTNSTILVILYVLFAEVEFVTSNSSYLLSYD